MSKKYGDLDIRMKAYEHCYRLFIPKKMYVIIRLDGKAFSSYTKGLDKPFDKGLMDDMDATTKYLCENIPNCKVGYVQSDEISLVLCDDASNETEPWFGNNLQKICSVSCSMATAKFNQLRLIRTLENGECGRDMYELREFIVDNKGVENIKLANFDSRVFILPNASEVLNYLHWRSQDATRNSISSVAQSLYSHKELHGVNSKQQQELIFQKGINWNDYSYREKRGGTFAKIYEGNSGVIEEGTRPYWQPVETPINWFSDRSDFDL